jgi:hypothetical protein
LATFFLSLDNFLTGASVLTTFLGLTIGVSYSSLDSCLACFLTTFFSYTCCFLAALVGTTGSSSEESSDALNIKV